MISEISSLGSTQERTKNGSVSANSASSMKIFFLRAMNFFVASSLISFVR